MTVREKRKNFNIRESFKICLRNWRDENEIELKYRMSQ